MNNPNKNGHAATPEAMMNVEELSMYLHIHRSTLYRMLEKHEIPGFKVGSDWRFKRELIDKWIDEKHNAK